MLAAISRLQGEAAPRGNDELLSATSSELFEPLWRQSIELAQVVDDEQLVAVPVPQDAIPHVPVSWAPDDWERAHQSLTILST